MTVVNDQNNAKKVKNGPQSTWTTRTSVSRQTHLLLRRSESIESKTAVDVDFKLSGESSADDSDLLLIIFYFW